jgi:hypothetical protein
MPALIACCVLTDILAYLIATDLYFSSLGYIGGTPSSDLNYTRRCFRCYLGDLRLYLKLSNRK